MQSSKKIEAAHANHRLEMFCDGVYAIAITLLVLDIKVPSADHVSSLSNVWRNIGDLWPSFLALILGFTTIFISWINHHKFLMLIDKSSPQFIVANGYFLFTLILVPFSTAFVAEYLDTPYAQPSIVLYCFNRLLHNTGWLLLHRTSVKPYSLFKNVKAIEIERKINKGLKFGFVIYTTMILLAFWLPVVALTLSVLISVYWFCLGVFRTPAFTE
jgi:uncharacterized membrane protein